MKYSKGIIKEFFPEWTDDVVKKLTPEENLTIVLFIMHIFDDIVRVDVSLETAFKTLKNKKS